MLKRFKHRKPKVYISLGIYVLLIFVIIFESCLNSSLSGTHSDFLASFYAFFINLFNGPQAVEVIKPADVSLFDDTTVLGQDEDGYSNIVIGTTSRIRLEVNYPAKKNPDDSFDVAYGFDYTVGNHDHYDIKNVSYNLVDTNKYNLVFYLVAIEKGDDIYKFKVTFAEKVTYEYSFHIVDIATPTDFEAKVEKSNLKIGETTRVLTKLNGDSRGNWFLNRYYDISKIARSSSNEAVATIDESGIIHALSNGSTTITYGSKSFNITVSSEHINIPATNSIALAKDPNSNDDLHLLDYDYVFGTKNYETGEKYDPNEYSVLVYSSFSDDTLGDKSVSWSLDSDMKGKISPYKYDEQGFPIYKDDLGRECIRVSGYREEGSLTLTCVSNVDNSITNSLVLTISEAYATSMEVNVKDGFEIMLGDQKTINASFSPVNTFNSAINVTCSTPIAVTITGNNSSLVTIKALKEGNYTLTVKSLSNDSLVKTINFKISAKQVINEKNFGDFASFMRKAAGHMGLFLVTAISGFVFFYFFLEDSKHRFLLAVLLTLGVGILLAGISEFIQYFVPSRSGEIADVGIDTIGTVLGIGLSSLVTAIILWIKKKKENKNKKEE